MDATEAIQEHEVDEHSDIVRISSQPQVSDTQSQQRPAAIKVGKFIKKNKKKPKLLKLRCNGDSELDSAKEKVSLNDTYTVDSPVFVASVSVTSTPVAGQPVSASHVSQSSSESSIPLLSPNTSDA